MKLRVITATRGESPFLDETTASVAGVVPHATVEHVVVCPAALTTEMARRTRARVIGEIRAGLYAALNHGMRGAGDDWDVMTWLNDDDRFELPGFATLLARMAAQPEIGVAYGNVAIIDRRSDRVGGLPVADQAGDLPALFAHGIMPLAQPGTVIRREIWMKLGGLNETYRLAGDLDFFVRAVRAGVRFDFARADVAAFRLHAGQLSKRRAEMDAETVRALAPCAEWSCSRAALWRFRWANLGRYMERVRRHGFVSMRTLYDRTA